MTCAVEWRSTSRPSSLAGTMIDTAASPGTGRLRSHQPPSTFAASASRPRRAPIDDAMSPGVVPSAYSRTEPSGSVTEMESDMGGRRYQRRSRVSRSNHAGPVRGLDRSIERDAEQRAELAQHCRSGGVVAAREDRAGKVVERFERLRRVEVAV